MAGGRFDIDAHHAVVAGQALRAEAHRARTEGQLQKAVSLAKTLYTEGQTDFLNVLDAQRSLFVTEETFVLSTSAISTDLVALYKALGGGWPEE